MWHHWILSNLYGIVHVKVDFIPIPKKAYNKITQICFFYSRLEDQLHLIHERFQELSMKFEMFQQQPSVEYEPRLARVARQLRDIKEKVLIRLISWDSDINCGLTKSLITETWGYCYISNFLSIFRNYFNAITWLSSSEIHRKNRHLCLHVKRHVW